MLRQDPNARYIQAGLGVFANTGRNTFPLSRISDIDLQLMKRFAITEGSRFEIAGQAFNLFNHPQATGDLLNDVYPNQFNNTRSFLLVGNPKFGHFDHFYTSNPRTLTITARFVFSRFASKKSQGYAPGSFLSWIDPLWRYRF